MTPLERIRYLRYLRMPTAAKLVLYTIASHCDGQGTCWLLQTTIGAEAGLEIRAVRNAVRFLADAGLIIFKRHGRKASSFVLTLEAFQISQLRPAPNALYNRHLVPVEVTTPNKRVKPQQLRLPPLSPKDNVIPFLPVEDRRPKCRCGAKLGAGDHCFPCYEYRESTPGIKEVISDYQPTDQENPP